MTSYVEKIVNFLLFVLFVYFVAKSWITFSKDDMGIATKLLQQPIDSPSISICPTNWVNGPGVSPENVQEIMGSFDKDFPIEFLNISVLYEDMDENSFIDLRNPEDIRAKMNSSWTDMWSKMCMRGWTETDCLPCLVLLLPEKHRPKKRLHIYSYYHEIYKDVMIEIHEPHQQSVTIFDIDWTSTLYIQTRSSKKTYWDMREEITEFLPNAEIPCDENNGQNLELSSKMLITKALNCKLTWLNFKTESRICTTKEDFENYFNLINSKEFIANNSLVKNCKKTSWKMTDTGDVTIEPPEMVEKIILESIKPQVVVKKEVALYSGNHLIADIGGYLGLLLGGSIPGIISLMQSTFRVFFDALNLRLNAK